MAKKLIISENHVRKFILDIFNNNTIGVKFMMSEWYSNMSVNDGSMLIIRREFTNDRFDIVSEFDETTYAIKENHITPMGIDNLNATFLAHPNIQEISYSPQVMFLISCDEEAVLHANMIALEEIRAGLMQRESILDISQYSLNTTNQRQNEKLKAVVTAGEISYGDIERINGRGYMLISMSLDVFITNFGEFSNQQKFLFGTSDILDTNNKPKMFEIPLIDWEYGMVLDTVPTQLALTNRTNNLKGSEVKSYRATKAFGMSFTIQIDFKNEFLTSIYLESIQQKVNVPTYYIEMWTNRYDDNNNLVELEGSRIKRAYNLEVNRPINSLSLGDKLEYSLVFSPSPEEWFE